jgi:hypothetical protein
MMFFRRQRASANDGLPWPRSSEWRRTLAATVRTSVQGVQGKEPQPTEACSVRRRGSPWRFGLVLLPAAAARGQEHAWARCCPASSAEMRAVTDLGGRGPLAAVLRVHTACRGEDDSGWQSSLRRRSSRCCAVQTCSVQRAGR